MIRHYLKVIWNRKRANLLIAIEVFFSFLVVFAVAAAATYYVNNYRQPLGYSFDDVWAIQVDAGGAHAPGQTLDRSGVAATFRELHAALRAMPEVRALAESFAVPYGGMQWLSDASVNGRSVPYGMNGVTDGYAEVFGIEMVQGRWFSRDDDAATWEPVVISARMAADMFGSESPIGKRIPQETTPSGEAQKEQRIVGVFREFRQQGEFADPENFAFARWRIDTNEVNPMMGMIVVRVAPGTTAVFEERLVKRMQEIAKGWSFRVTPVAEFRSTQLRQTIGPLVAMGIIAGFLMIMVAMGLTGVLWQAVTQRTREIGLRRAKGATVRNIRRQVIGELLMMTSASVVLGAAVVVQIPLEGALGQVPAGVLATSVAASALCIYLLTLLCAWYPSRMSTGIPPAEALRYE